jgi:solute carrier family 25 carnitine/acylcarnitine transporter 20/29
MYAGPFDAIKKIFSAHGIAGIYKGQAVTLLREATGYGVYFLSYEKLIQWEMRRKAIRRDQVNPMNTVLYGAAAGYAVSHISGTIVPFLTKHPALGSYIPHRYG